MPASPDEIANAFGQLVLRYGYRRTSMDDVARMLHISKQTIYEHFRTKEDLYRRSLALWAQAQRARVESMLTATTALGRITQATAIAFADARRSFEANPVQDVTEPSEIADEVNRRVFLPMVRDLIAQGNESGELHVADPAMTATFAVTVGTEAVRIIREDPTCDAEEAALDAIRRLIAGTVQ